MARTKPRFPNPLPSTKGRKSSGPGLLAKSQVGRAGKVYTVKRGDTLSSIAKRHGTTVSALLKANKRLRTDPKYKGGNTIFSGTRVRLR